MILDYNEARKELLKKYNLEYTNNEEYLECISYLRTNNCYIELYGYKWEANSTNRSLRYNCTPVLGKFYLTGPSASFMYFDEYDPKKPGKVKRTVNGTIRNYAKTYLEAVEGYNQSIDKQIERLRELEDWANSYRLQ